MPSLPRDFSSWGYVIRDSFHSLRSYLSFRGPVDVLIPPRSGQETRAAKDTRGREGRMAFPCSVVAPLFPVVTRSTLVAWSGVGDRSGRAARGSARLGTAADPCAAVGWRQLAASGGVCLFLALPLRKFMFCSPSGLGDPSPSCSARIVTRLPVTRAKCLPRFLGGRFSPVGGGVFLLGDRPHAWRSPAVRAVQRAEIGGSRPFPSSPRTHADWIPSPPPAPASRGDHPLDRTITDEDQGRRGGTLLTDVTRRTDGRMARPS